MANSFARLTAVSQDVLRQLAERRGGGDAATRDSVWLRRHASYLSLSSVSVRSLRGTPGVGKPR
jgi:hypothetical protein